MSSARKIAILGFGREGRSVLKFLQNRGPGRNKRGLTQKNFPPKSVSGQTGPVSAEIWVLDKNKNLKLPRGIKSQLGSHYLKQLGKFDVIFRSPGIPYNLPELRLARKKGVKFGSATKLFFKELRETTQNKRRVTQNFFRVSRLRSVRVSPRPIIIGITGTKGKGTTATLLYKILKAARRPVFLAGNIGKPALEILPQLSASSQRNSATTVAVLELSSFQLQDLDVSPPVAVVLDVFPDHQDNHLNLKEYYNAKASIAKYQKKGDKIFFFINNDLSRWVAQKSRGRKIGVDEKRFQLFNPDDLRVRGYHNFKNAVMAATVARSLGVPQKVILKAVKNFRGLEHRLEFVRRITLKNNSQYSHAFADSHRAIEFWNDSASTNPQTTAAAIQAFPNQPKILIAGGQDKNLDYKPLAKALKNSKTKLVVLFGENKKKIWKAIKSVGIPIKFAQNLHEAVKVACIYSKFYPATPREAVAERLELVRSRLSPTEDAAKPSSRGVQDPRQSNLLRRGEVGDSRDILNSIFLNIVLSPGAASFDMFKDYADRGRQFKKMVKKL